VDGLGGHVWQAVVGTRQRCAGETLVSVRWRTEQAALDSVNAISDWQTIALA
jgi:hypothetical protein